MVDKIILGNDNKENINLIKKNILSLYSLEDSEVTVIKFKDTEKQRAIYKVTYRDKAYCLKKVYYDENSLLYVYSAMEWLFRNGINVPKLLPCKNNERFVKYDSMLFILTPWVEGNKCNFDNLEHLELSIKTLAKVHRVSNNFFPIIKNTSRETLYNYSESIEKHHNELLQSLTLAQKYNDKFSSIFLENFNNNLELSKLSLQLSYSIDTSNLSTSLCHGDYVNKNIIINDNNDLWLIDFDKCKYDYCAHDISYFLRRLLKRSTTNWNCGLTLNLLNTYIKTKNLTDSDLKYILAYLAFPQKYWKISRDYYKNINKCNKSSFITILNKSLDKTENQLEYIYRMIDIMSKYYDISF